MGQGSTKSWIKTIRTLTWGKLFGLVLALCLIAISWLGLLRAESGLLVRKITVDGTPMQFVISKESQQVPGVLIAHGYCGSSQLMKGYATTLAQNGYGVMLWDLPGHGANPHSFKYEEIESNFELPLSTLKSQPEIDSTRLAVVGHSMGSGVAMAAGITHEDEIDAVIAISPMGAPVTPDTPKNLALQLGVWETFLQDNANRLLNEAGGANSVLAEGKGRSLSTIRNAEHATILFKDQSHQETLDWLNQTFQLDQKTPFRDRRMAWYGLHLLGCLLGLMSVLPWFRSDAEFTKVSSQWRVWGGLALAPLVGGIAFKLINFNIPVETIGRLMIGGALGLWFFIVGLIWLVTLGHWPLPKQRDLTIGVIGFVVLWFGFGLMAQVTWLPWFLTPGRFLLWVCLAIGYIPWFLASSIAFQPNTFLQGLIGTVVQSVAVLIGLSLTIIATPNIGFLAIMFPAFPLLFGIFAMMYGRSKSLWGNTLGSALIFSWLTVVPFPIL